MGDIKQVTVERTGRRPLKFTGELIARADNSHDGVNHADRWAEARVYARPDRAAMMPPAGETWRPRGKGFVLAVARKTRWEGEHDRRDAFVCDTLRDLAAAIETELPPIVADEMLAALGDGVAEDLDEGAAS